MQLLCRSLKSELEMKIDCSVLQLCAELKSLEDGQKVHSIICSNSLVVDGVLGAKLVFMYVSCGDLREGRCVFDKVASEEVLSLESYDKFFFLISKSQFYKSVRRP